MYIRINFDVLNDILNDVKHFHYDLQKRKKIIDAAVEDIKNLFFILVIGQWNIWFFHVL